MWWKNSRISSLVAVSVVVLAFNISSVRSEYTWNGSEWVWTESKNPSPPSNTNTRTSYESEEGSGGYNYNNNNNNNNNRYSDYYDEDGDDDTGFDDYDEGSGSNAGTSDVVPDNDPYDNWNTNDQQRNFNSNNNNNNNPAINFNNNNYGDPYNANPVDPYAGRGQDISQNYFTTSPPYFGNEAEKTDDIYVDPPMIPVTTTTTIVPPKDPSISSRPKDSSRSTSFFAQPGTLAAVIGGAVVGLLCAILCVMFVVYRMRKKDEGSYALDEPKRSPTVNAYAKHPSREFYA